jgi:dTMP kinase
MAFARSHAYPGLFLVLDGPDGGGKTTQAERLARWLRERGFDVVTCRDPGGTALGDRLRSILQDRVTVPLSMRSEMLLYMASRAQLVEDVIAPALAAGKIVVSDRYLLSNIVYQGSAGGLLEEEIAMVGLVATAGLLPDLTIVLDIAPADAMARIGAPRDRIEDRPLFYHERVRAGYLSAAGAQAGQPGDALAGGSPVYPAPIVLVEASGDSDTVYKRIQYAVAQALSSRGS